MASPRREALTPQMLALLDALRAAGGTLLAYREAMGSVLGPSSKGPNTVNAAVWRSLQARGLVRVTRLGQGRFRVTLVQQEAQVAHG